MTNATAPVDTDPVTTEEEPPFAPGPNDEIASEAAEKARKPRKVKCPFLIEYWFKQSPGDDGGWRQCDVPNLESTAQALAWAQRNLEGGTYRIIQVRDKFAIRAEKVTKTTIDRG